MKDSIGYKIFKVINAIILILIVIATVYPFGMLLFSHFQVKMQSQQEMLF